MASKPTLWRWVGVGGKHTLTLTCVASRLLLVWGEGLSCEPELTLVLGRPRSSGLGSKELLRMHPQRKCCPALFAKGVRCVLPEGAPDPQPVGKRSLKSAPAGGAAAGGAGAAVGGGARPVGREQHPPLPPMRCWGERTR